MARNAYSNTMARRITTGSPSVAVLEPLGNIQVTVKIGGSGTNATIFQTRTGASQGPTSASGATGTNPFTTGTSGAVEFWAEEGDYDILIHDLNVPARISDVTYGWSASSGVSQRTPLDNSVATAKLQDNAITNAKMNDNSVAAAEIQGDAVGSSELAPLAVTATEIGAGAGRALGPLASVAIPHGISGGANSTTNLLTGQSFSMPYTGSIVVVANIPYLEFGAAGSTTVAITTQVQIDSGTWTTASDGALTASVGASGDFFLEVLQWTFSGITSGSHTFGLRFQVGNNPVTVGTNGRGRVFLHAV